MQKIRQEKRLCTDDKRIDQFLSHARTGYLGLTDKENPYVVPLNFIWMNEALYFHGAAHGRKIDLIQANPNCCFTVCEEYGTTVSPIPAKTDTAYMSVMLFGALEKVTDLQEATTAMQAMLDKYVPGYYDQSLSSSHVEKYRSSLGSHTVVFKLTPSVRTAKENPLDPQLAFYPGRNVQMDT
ncbi:pyridoxamine 5'-phosphate oxidase family protein [Bacillus thermotolerans]|uniref:pyridoxamine 5'-phosphate oxidase family protein n=1 Tax=Bacillus thermotolerans TaxID=1221996 RepID=UPI00057FF513|nr:pyridoxamine 5'-phosphate oxidase family protein [Bacillus thermotolerans]KKB34293.1 Pyridoxamine 5'-phosphate oxidase [Bacillus thermotolerans]KKB42021.1 Pyridoxamine 5'-phosphate oxidase [Bacillus thermotolerans]